jgi:hypothetical protein
MAKSASAAAKQEFFNTIGGKRPSRWCKIDRGSFIFRYPVDRKGTPVQVGIERPDLIELCNVMAAIDGYFTGMFDYLDDLTQNAV